MLESLILPLVLSFLMFGLGMSLQLSDFFQAFKRWPIVLVSLASIYLAMAGFAFLIARFLGLDESLTMGLIVLATCPGGMFSNMLTHSADGDVALSVTLTVCSSLFYAIAMPLAIFVWLGAMSPVSVMQATMLRTMGEILCVVILPLGIGMFMRKTRLQWSLKYEKLVRDASSVLIACVFIALALSQYEQFKSAGLVTIAAVLLLNLSGWSMALILMYAFKLSKKELIAIGAEHSIRQEGLGAFVAINLLLNAKIVPPILINSFIGLFVSVTCVALIRMRSRAVGQPNAGTVVQSE